MQVEIVVFPETRVAVIEHRGPPEREHDTARQLVAWKREHGLVDQAKYRTYGLHHADPRTVAPADYRMEICLSIDCEVGANPHGIREKILPRVRCARARDIGSRLDNQAVKYLFEGWLPASGETWTGDPAIFHYVNVGPGVLEGEAITDVYLPLREAAHGPSLNGRKMRVVQTAPNGVVGAGTIFHFSQVGDVVEARYAGGRIVTGFLVGVRQGDLLSFRYCQISDQVRVDGGASSGRLETLGDGRLRLTETFAWESRGGDGVNVFEECE